MAERTDAGVRVASSTRHTSKPKAESDSQAEKRILTELASAGLVTPGDGSVTAFRPLKVEGQLVSETVLENRNDRL